MTSFADEARQRCPADALPYNRKREWLAARIPGFSVALSDDCVTASAVTALLGEKGYPVPYRTVRRWCNEARGGDIYG